MGTRTGYGEQIRREPPAPAPKSLLRDYAETILVCVIFVVFTRTFIFQQSKIPSESMMDTLLVGDYIMVNRFIYSPVGFDWERRLLPQREIRRGDVVVFKKPQEPEVDYIKRVVGLPGDAVELRDGRLYVNGQEQQEPYVRERYRFSECNERLGPIRFGPVKVAAGNYFMMGDHRCKSADSRSWGQVPQELIKGRALVIWWSYEEDRDTTTLSALQQIRSWGSKLLHFPTRSRWDRCFSLIR
jgi:signal peptidase I